MHSVVTWMLLTAVCALFSWQLYRSGRLKIYQAIALPVLVFYISFVLTITLIERVPADCAKYELSLFWSYRSILDGNRDLIEENVLNVVLFMPFGVLLPALLRKPLWISVVSGIALSAFIEITQLITYRGLFEFDDIVHNTLGTVLGIFIFLILKKIDRG